eukprot:25725-Prymnesium_polylepis.1
MPPRGGRETSARIDRSPKSPYPVGRARLQLYSLYVGPDDIGHRTHIQPYHTAVQRTEPHKRDEPTRPLSQDSTRSEDRASTFPGRSGPRT